MTEDERTSGTAGADLLCVSPHTDDAEIACGGTLARFSSRGRRVWLLDLTRGELGSNGTPDERWEEAARASAALGITGRLQAALPDGFVSAERPEQVAAVAAVIRSLRPRWLLAAPVPRRHPDHQAIPSLVRKAAFMARLASWPAALPEMRAWPPQAAAIPPPTASWICEAVLTVCAPGERPNLYVDVTASWPAKLAALRCYATQLERAAGARPTVINEPAFLDQVERWSRAWGFQAGVPLAEAFATEQAPLLEDLPAERWV
ncbi:MAG: bacillithiol biosynthesis deacetylase BshB1 [Candidatus Latescibacteria bacterium]|nr:bacillithiol biosynthesis deacetylase BshB1 [Candidatus Latescibacterota bacterium]